MNDEARLEIQIVPNSSVKQSQTDKDNKAIAYYQSTVQSPLVDQVESTKNFTKAMGQPVELVKEQQAQSPEQQAMGSGLPGMPGMKGQPTSPTQANMNLL